MTDSLATLNTPVLWINKYLQEKISELAGLGLVPFFPTGPTTLETLQTQFPEGGTMAVYDRMFRMRRGLFHISNVNKFYIIFMLQDQTLSSI
jgi:hypothetical protein